MLDLLAIGAASQVALFTEYQTKDLKGDKKEVIQTALKVMQAFCAICFSIVLRTNVIFATVFSCVTLLTPLLAIYIKNTSDQHSLKFGVQLADITVAAAPVKFINALMTALAVYSVNPIAGLLTSACLGWYNAQVLNEVYIIELPIGNKTYSV